MTRCLLTVDVEDWFHVENLRPVVTRASWETRESRVVANTRRVLDLFETQRVRGTFFVLSWVAEREPALIRDISARGHEVASHGYSHDLVYKLSPEEFRADIRRAKATIEDIIGQPVVGYRAPNFSITEQALQIIKEEGYRYDASYFPSALHDRYGKIDRGRGEAPPIQEIIPGLQEVRVSTLRVAGHEMPWGGGAYFRLIPYAWFRFGIRRILERNGPYLFYFHPWEMDPGQPRITGLPATSRFRHYTGLDKVEGRLVRLLKDFQFVPIRDAIRLS